MSDAIFSNITVKCESAGSGFLINPGDLNCIDNAPSPLSTLLPLMDSTSAGAQHPPEAASREAVILISILFCLVGAVGTVGNLLVILVIVTDKKMRRSVTNLFIVNMAVADLMIMLFGVPEIVQFMMNQGWVLGEFLCRFQRSILVIGLYASVMTLMAVCIERYVAIVHPITAHILCSRRRTLWAISGIWPVALICGLPTMIFNKVVDSRDPSIKHCSIRFPGNHVIGFIAFKIGEFTLFYFIPVLVQTILYIIIAKHLFISTKDLHRAAKMRGNSTGKELDSGAIKARKGVVKMLIACVLVYTLSYAPPQIPLFYNLISPRNPFPVNWTFMVCIVTLSYINSAANPLLYSIFSQNFRRQFRRMICRCLMVKGASSKQKRGTISLDTMKVYNNTTATSASPKPPSESRMSTAAITVM